MELEIATLLKKSNIDFYHESDPERPGPPLDFYLPYYGIYIEVKRFHSDRISKQLQYADNVIVIQGIESLNFIKEIFSMLISKT